LENISERIEQLRPKSPPPKGVNKTAAGTTTTPTPTNPNANSTSTQQSISSTIPSSSSSSTKELSSSIILQDGQQAIRSTITSNRQSSSRAIRPHWGLYPDDIPSNVYPPIMLSPTRHPYPGSYPDLHL